MPARRESCCFTGHRPGKLPWGYDETDPRCLDLKRRMADAVEAAYAQGFRHFHFSLNYALRIRLNPIGANAQNNLAIQIGGQNRVRFMNTYTYVL